MASLETSVTRSNDVAEDKTVHYRMRPENIPSLTVAMPGVCALANNHVLDFGYRGLADTLEALTTAGIPAVGAGHDAEEARQPATVPAPGGGSVNVFSFGARSSGIPGGWAATGDRAGVDLLPDLSATTAGDLTGRIRAPQRPGD